MIEKIRNHLVDIIAADARIYRSGNSYATAFLGVKRPEAGDTPAANFVNLFDGTYEPDGDDARPAIYCGVASNDCTDELDFNVCSGGRVEFRIVKVPLVIVAHAQTKRVARQMRSQLRANLVYILMDHFIEAGYWWQMNVPGNQGGGDVRQVNSLSETGGNNQGVVVAHAIVPVVAHYSIMAGGTDA